MDCVFVKARKISRSLKGNRGSAVNYSKYLDRTLKGVDYADKGKLLSSGICGTNETPLEFWKKAEERELQTKRKATARFAKEYIVALPHNLTKEDMAELSKLIANKMAINGRVVSWYLHEPDGEGDGRNYHTHLLMSEREYINGRFSETKNRNWNEKKFLAQNKKDIGEIINERLLMRGLEPIKIELREDEIIGSDKTERQIKAERANAKKLAKAERKIKLAEEKLNGLGRTERQYADSINGNQEFDSTVNATTEEQRKRYADFRETQRVRRQEQQRIAEEQKRNAELARKEQERITEQRRQEQQRINKKRSSSYDGFEW